MKTCTAPTTSVTWTQQSPATSVATQHGDFVATIERLQAFVVTGPGGDVIGSYSTLAKAENVIDHPVAAGGQYQPHHRVRLPSPRIAAWTLSGIVPFAGVFFFGAVLITGAGR